MRDSVNYKISINVPFKEQRSNNDTMNIDVENLMFFIASIFIN